MASQRSAAAIRSVLFDLLITAGVLGLTAASAARSGVWAPGAVMAVAVLFRRRFPFAVMLAVAIAALAQITIFYTSPDPFPFDVALGIAMYSVVKYASTLTLGYVAAGIMSIGIGIEVTRQSDNQWVAQLLFYTGIFTAIWLTAYVTRTRKAYVVGLEERAATLEREREHLTQLALAQERASIAREMHDVVAHSLAVIIVQADGGRYAMAANPDAGRTVLETVAATGREALDEMRRLIELLRGGEVGEAAERETGRTVVGLDQIPSLVARARSAGLTVDLECEPGAPVPTTADLAAYRITQEALTNVLRHAGPAARVLVTVRHEPDVLRLSIVDDGGGTGTPRATGSGHAVGHGLVGMRERVAVHGGTFQAGPRPGGGWSVSARIPLPRTVPA